MSCNLIYVIQKARWIHRVKPTLIYKYWEKIGTYVRYNYVRYLFTSTQLVIHTGAWTWRICLDLPGRPIWLANSFSLKRGILWQAETIIPSGWNIWKLDETLSSWPPIEQYIAGYPIAATAPKRETVETLEFPHLGWRLAIPGLSAHCRVRILGRESQQFYLGASQRCLWCFWRTPKCQKKIFRSRPWNHSSEFFRLILKGSGSTCFCSIARISDEWIANVVWHRCFCLQSWPPKQHQDENSTRKWFDDTSPSPQVTSLT